MAAGHEPETLGRMRGALHEWYGPRQRACPWRRRPDPYRILVSEVA
ncbi:MAG: hypothetical protein ACRDJF_09855 [Actinomycetota bacterium]